MRMSIAIVRGVLVRALGASIILVGLGGACPLDQIPPCPGQCFGFTLELTEPVPCQDGENTPYPIAFTGHDPDGYHGRTCFNSTSVLLVVEAIEHLHAGGQLSDLNADVISAYVTTVNTVRADLEAQCITAAPGQCTNAAEVCSVIGGQAYEQLVIEESCVLGLDGTEPVSLSPGQTCEAIADDQATSSADGTDPCPDPTTAASLDDTAASDGADDTSGTT